MKFMASFIMASLLASCSTMHLKLQSQYESPKGKGQVTFQKSYDLASFPYICAGSAIFFGGGCWSYLMMPMVPQEQRFIKDAEESLKEKLGTSSVTLVEPEVTRESWHNEETKIEVSQ